MIQEDEIIELFRRGGRFEVKKILGIGGMGVVVQAFDTRLKVLRAIKIFNPELLKHDSLIRRFQNEASIMAGIDHPNIVKVYDIGEIESYHYMVLEWINGGSLASVLRTSGAIHPRVALDLMYRVCDALSVAHKRGIIHRDIKPDNILITKEGVPKVTDFGIAHVDEDHKKRVTSTGESIGSSGYTSPQQWSNFALTDARDDIYSLAVTFWELMTDLRPPSVLFFHDIEAQPELLNTVPTCLRGIVKKAASYNASERYQSVEEFAHALEAVEADLPPLGGAVIMSVDVGDGIGVVDPTVVGATRMASKKPEPPVVEPTRISQQPPVLERSGETLAYRPSGDASPVAPSITTNHGPAAIVGEAREPPAPPAQMQTEPVVESKQRRSFILIVSTLCVAGVALFFWVYSRPSKIPVPEQQPVAVVTVPEPIPTPPPPDVSIAVDVSVVDIVSVREPEIPTVVVQIPVEQPIEKPQEKKDRKGAKSSKSTVVKAGETLLVEPEHPKLEPIKVQVSLKIPNDDTVRVWLVGPGGRHKMPGSVAPGIYKVVAIFKDQDTETVALSKFEVTEGASLRLSCDSAREVCQKL